MAENDTTLIRIIFRGLMLFTFEKKLRPEDYDVDDPPDDPPNLGAMRVFLVDDSQATMPHHQHPPRLKWTGTGHPDGKQTNASGKNAGRRVTIDWDTSAGSGPDGVRVEPSFVRHVPRLSRFLGGDFFKLTDDESRLDRYVASEFVIPRGRVFARQLVRWPSPLYDAPSAVVEMMTMQPDPPSGLMADEVTVEMQIVGSSNRLANLTYVTLKEGQSGTLRRLRPYTTGTPKDLIDPNAIEILVTSFPAQRIVPVPWGIHFQMLFQLHDTPGQAQDNFNQATLLAFRSKLTATQQEEWDADLAHMGPDPAGGVGFPFPIVRDPQNVPASVPPFRSPEYRPLCPPGWGDDGK